MIQSIQSYYKLFCNGMTISLQPNCGSVPGALKHLSLSESDELAPSQLYSSCSALINYVSDLSVPCDKCIQLLRQFLDDKPPRCDDLPSYDDYPADASEDSGPLVAPQPSRVDPRTYDQHDPRYRDRLRNRDHRRNRYDQRIGHRKYGKVASDPYHRTYDSKHMSDVHGAEHDYDYKEMGRGYGRRFRGNGGRFNPRSRGTMYRNTRPVFTKWDDDEYYDYDDDVHVRHWGERENVYGECNVVSFH